MRVDTPGQSSVLAVQNERSAPAKNQGWRSAPVGVALLFLLGAMPIPAAGGSLLYPAAIFAAIPAIRLVSTRLQQLRLPLIALGVAAASGMLAAVVYGVEPSELLQHPAIRILACLMVVVTIWDSFGLSSGHVVAVAAGCTVVHWVPGYWDQGFDSLWKYALGTPLAILVLIATQRWAPNRVLITAMALLVLTLLSLLAAFRSEALQLAMVLGIALTAGWNGTPNERLRRVLTVGAVSTIVMVIVVPRVAETGIFGDRVDASFRADEAISSNPLLGGRVELPVSLATFEEEPFLGQGKIPKLTTDLLFQASSIAQSLGVQVTPTTIRAWSIPQSGQVSAHSVIMQMAIVGGLAGLVVGVYLLGLLCRGVLRWAVHDPRSSAQILLMAVAVWDMAFSPMLTGRDLLIASALLIAVLQSPRRLEAEPAVENTCRSNPTLLRVLGR